jgi:signal peptidase I
MTEETTKTSAGRELLEIGKTIGVALLIALVLRVVLFQPYTIPSESMEPGLLKGDYIIVTKFSYGWSRYSIPFSPPLPDGRLFGKPVTRGDVVVFQLPRDDRQTLIKRIVGLPGDRLQVKAGVLYVNGKPNRQTPLGVAPDPGDVGVPVERIRETDSNGRSYITLDREAGREGDDTGVYVVPENHYFAMGDNRDNSLDSRWPQEIGVGFIPADHIVGKAQVILASWKGGAAIFNPVTWVTRFDLDRLMKPIH